MGDQDWNVLTNKMQGYTTSKVPLPQIFTLCTCILLIYSIISLVSFLIPCRNRLLDKALNNLNNLLTTYPLPEWPHPSVRSFVISAQRFEGWNFSRRLNHVSCCHASRSLVWYDTGYRTGCQKTIYCIQTLCMCVFLLQNTLVWSHPLNKKTHNGSN